MRKLHLTTTLFGILGALLAASPAFADSLEHARATLENCIVHPVQTYEAQCRQNIQLIYEDGPLDEQILKEILIGDGEGFAHEPGSSYVIAEVETISPDFNSLRVRIHLARNPERGDASGPTKTLVSEREAQAEGDVLSAVAIGLGASMR